jgi:hypothetical protein
MLVTLVRGAFAGAAATWLMDQVTAGIQQQQSPEDAEREAAARPNGKTPAANLVDYLAERIGVDLPESSRGMAEQIVHFGLGAGPGALYALLRGRLPGLGAGGGLFYGALLFAVNDEYVNTALGLAGPPDAYPLSSHLRGLVGHLVLGVATDIGIEVTGG